MIEKRIQKALAEGKAIPTELRDDAQKLKASLDADDDVTENLKTHIDDEYKSWYHRSKNMRHYLTKSKFTSKRR